MSIKRPRMDDTASETNGLAGRIESALTESMVPQYVGGSATIVAATSAAGPVGTPSTSGVVVSVASGCQSAGPQASVAPTSSASSNPVLPVGVSATPAQVAAVPTATKAAPPSGSVKFTLKKTRKN